MRSSTRTAAGVRVPLLALVLTLAACSTATGAARPADDHSTDVGERVRANTFSAADHSLDAIESQKGGAFSH